MDTLTLPRKAAALEYRALTLAPRLLETQVVTRFLDEESALRLGFERVLGSLDETAGRLLKDETLETRGRQLRRRTEVLETAAELEAKAKARVEQAEQKLQAEKAAADARREQAREQARTQVQQTLQQEQQAKATATRTARSRAQAAKDAARDEAARKAQAVERDLEQKERVVDLRERSVTAAPKAQLAEAVADQQEAAKARSTAERLEDLQEAEKAKRQAEREARAAQS